MVANGCNRGNTVADQGAFAGRGGILDLVPAGEEMGLRVDFFGDEIESIRRFDPADQRSLGPARALSLLPAAETLLDAATIKRFRAGYRDQFGAAATGDRTEEHTTELQSLMRTSNDVSSLKKKQTMTKQQTQNL